MQKGHEIFFKKTTKSRHHRLFAKLIFISFICGDQNDKKMSTKFFFSFPPPSLVFSKKMSLCIDSKQKHVLFHKQTDTNKEGDVVTSKGCHRRGVRWSLFLPTPALLLRATMRPFEVSRPMQKLLCRHLKKSRAFTFVYYWKVFFLTFSLRHLFATNPKELSSHICLVWLSPTANCLLLTSDILSGLL